MRPTKGFGIAALVFAVLAYVAFASWIFGLLFPVFLCLSLVVASWGALTGDRRYAVAAIAACLTILVLVSTYSVVWILREENAPWRIAVIVGFFAPVAGLFYATVRSRARFKAYVLPTLVLFAVLAGFQITGLLKVGADWGWQRGGLEPQSVQLSDEVCFSRPDFSCVLELAKKEGLPVQERVWILSKLAAVQFTAGNAAAAIALLTEAISSYQFPSRIGARLLRKIATLQWKAGDSAAAKETLNTARIAAQGSTGVNELLCVERSQIKIGDTLGAQATRTAALLKTRNPNSRPRSRIDGWMRIAAASAEVGDQVASREVLAEALAAALELEDSKIRSLTVRDVIQGYLVIGDLEMASSLIEKIEHQYTRRLVIHAVAQVRDNPGTARRLYKLRCGWEYGAIVSSCRRQREMHEGTHYGEARSLAIDAVDQINAGKSSEAIETLNQALSHARQLSNGPPINPEYRRDRTLALIAPMQAAAGLENAASETVRNIDHVVSRNIALRDIAMVRVHAGNIKGALLNVWWIAKQPIDTRPTVRARALGYVALAIGSHSANPDHQTLNWCALMVFYGIKCGLSCTKTDVWSAYF